jgi:hypothetical protein
MAYMLENFNSIRFICNDLSDNSVYETLTFSGYSYRKPKDENKKTVNVNDEILIDSVGMRMEIEVELINRESLNTQSDFQRLFDCVNKVQLGTHRFTIYPEYHADYQILSLDNFECVMNGYYDIKKLHDFLKSGQQFKLKLQEYIPNKNYIPKIPRTYTHSARVGSQGNMV